MVFILMLTCFSKELQKYLRKRNRKVLEENKSGRKACSGMNDVKTVDIKNVIERKSLLVVIERPAKLELIISYKLLKTFKVYPDNECVETLLKFSKLGLNNITKKIFLKVLIKTKL